MKPFRPHENILSPAQRVRFEWRLWLDDDDQIDPPVAFINAAHKLITFSPASPEQESAWEDWVDWQNMGGFPTVDFLNSLETLVEKYEGSDEHTGA